jgi:hypothetical protein
MYIALLLYSVLYATELIFCVRCAHCSLYYTCTYFTLVQLSALVGHSSLVCYSKDCVCVCSLQQAVLQQYPADIKAAECCVRCYLHVCNSAKLFIEFVCAVRTGQELTAFVEKRWQFQRALLCASCASLCDASVQLQVDVYSA